MLLPTTKESKVLYFDPTVVNRDEIRDANGNLIAPAGSTFNPLDIVNFTKTLVVFDATSPKQFAFAKKIADFETAKSRGVILITTSIDREKGFAAITTYNRQMFPHKVFLLDEQLVERFGLTAIPSVVRAQGRIFKIEQTSEDLL